jgi:hypothetical protein
MTIRAFHGTSTVPMLGYYHRWSGRSTAKHDLSAVPKLCPKYVRNIKNYQNTSKSIQIRKALKAGVLQGKPLIFCTFASAAVSYTRKKSPVQILYRPFSFFPLKEQALPNSKPKKSLTKLFIHKSKQFPKKLS